MPVLRLLRASLYDAAIVWLTSAWYRAVLERLPSGCRLLDVGIGTGSALLANADLLVDKQIHVTGIDVDAAYVERCQRQLARRGVGNSVEARLQSVYEHLGGPYDAVYFSGSFMLLPDPAAALRHVGSLLDPDGRVYFTQTFEHRRSRLIELIKPLLRLVTTIDFGRVTYEAEFRKALAEGRFELEEIEALRTGQRRSSVLAIARAVE